VLVTGTMELFEVFVMISDLDGIYGFWIPYRSSLSSDALYSAKRWGFCS
jgi:hypothetical protein